ncbi:T9SS sorting signal type C domain-containing protein [Flavobacterium sp. ACAM 123]|uniref:T9SS sorting signal type C domain-containing protein n=1 Tax=Flavobacterium sp. ACAM 123 TaxID=1189620 RepID=UPI0003199B3A|nr:T9SS sorting signal type C domain-containing protein [Flavobacterium sp. ACAM 123]
MTNAACSGVGFTSTPFNTTNGVVPTGTTYTWTTPSVTGGLTGGVSGSGSSIAGTLSNPTSSAQTATYTVTPTLGSCAGAHFTITITVNPLPTAPNINSTTQPTCTVSTGSITLGGLPSGGWKLYRSGTSSATDGSGTTTTINGLAAGDYTFTVDNLTCISSSSLTATISNAYVPVNRWSGKVWSSGTPTLDQQIVFEDSYEEFVDVIEGCSCIVKAGKTVTIRSRKTLRIVNQVEVRGDGILTFEDKASLVQIKDVPADLNLGKITYRRSTLPILKTDYVYWSTPVTTAALGDIQSGTLYYSFNALGNKWVNASAGTAMDTGKGYIVRGAGTWFDTGSITLTPNFKGVPNNGIVKAYLTPGKNNLIGNPYPSAIDGDAFINANTNTTALSNSLSGTLYFWTHKSTIQLASNITNGTAGSGKFAYTSDDYDTYTLTGGTGGLNTGTIAAGQGFFAPASSTGGNAIFNNSMRLSSSGGVLDNAQFLKQVVGSKAIKTTSNSKLDKNRVWLNLTNSGGAFKQILIGYITGATNGYESTYDGNNFNANSFVNFYSINQNRNLTIEGRALPFDQDDVVPLGYKSTIVEEFKIAIDKTDGFLSNKKINLEDKLLGKIQDLSEAPYVFTTEVGTFNERFVLSYANKTAASTIMLGTGDYKKASEAVLISNKNKEIKISSSTNEIDKVFVYDLSGRQIYTASKVEKNELIIKTIMSSNQVLIIKVVLQNQSTVNKKIIY